MTMTINNVGRLELSRFYGIFGIVSTEIQLILLIFVRTDVYAFFSKCVKKIGNLIVQKEEGNSFLDNVDNSKIDLQMR